jgi:hypothetical protein
MCNVHSPSLDLIEAGAPEDKIEISPEEAREELAKRLHFRMERLDPGSSGTLEWSELSEQEREFYRGCVNDLTGARELVQIALERSRKRPEK